MLRSLVLAAAIALVAAATASADPAQLAFVHDGRVFTMSADGSGRAPVPLPLTVQGRPVSYGDVAYTPDGQGLLVSFSTENGPTQFASVPASGGQPQVLARERSGGAFVLSPDGTQLAFGRTTKRRDAIVSEIVVRRLDGSGSRVLARAEYSEQSLSFVGGPVWSPDGRQVLYTRGRVVGQGFSAYDLHLVRADGTGDRRLTRDGEGGAWSPDGTQIAFTSRRDKNGEHTTGSDETDYDGEIYVMAADGSAQRRLTDRVGEDVHPTWSADGTRLAFSSDANFPTSFNENLEVWSTGLDGSCLTQLTNGTPLSADAAWRPGDMGATAPSCGSLPAPTVDVALPSSPFGLGVGLQFNGLLLSDVQADPDGTTLYDYGDCGAATPSECPAAMLISTTSVCDRDVAIRALLSVTGRPRRIRGALVIDDGTDGLVQLLTGKRLVVLQNNGNPVDDRSIDTAAVVRGLAPAGQAASGQLAGPALPASALRSLSEAVSVRRSTGSASAAARRLGVDPQVVRERLQAARGLKRLRPVRRLSC